jgi:hypothetical protein
MRSSMARLGICTVAVTIEGAPPGSEVIQNPIGRGAPTGQLRGTLLLRDSTDPKTRRAGLNLRACRRL